MIENNYFDIFFFLFKIFKIKKTSVININTFLIKKKKKN
jgi:hypothetical protein